MSKVDRKVLRVYRAAMREWRKHPDCPCALCRSCAAAAKGGRK